MNIEIKKAELMDFDQVYNLIKEFSNFIKTPEKVSITLEQMIIDKNYFQCLVAKKADKVIGFSTYFIAYYSWTGKAIYLDDLYVLETYRGLGIGNKLFDKIIEIAQIESCKKVRWQVSNWNKKAIEFYKKRGAVIDEIEINCDLAIS